MVKLSEAERGDRVQPSSLAYALVIGDIGGAVGGGHANGESDSARRERASRFKNRIGRTWRTGRTAVAASGPAGVT